MSMGTAYETNLMFIFVLILAGAMGVGSAKSSLLFLKILVFGEDLISDVAKSNNF